MVITTDSIGEGGGGLKNPKQGAGFKNDRKLPKAIPQTRVKKAGKK